jgi:hypothetical protein
MPEEQKRKISKALSGRQFSAAHRLALSKAASQRRYSVVAKEKMSVAKRAYFARGGKHPMKGRTHKPESIAKMKSKVISLEHRDRLRAANSGKEFSVETRHKLRESHLGSKCHLWRGGIYPEHKALRKCLEYKLWRERVFQRDNYTCQTCKQVGGHLNADHILPFAQYPKLRFDVSNGRTLCVGCHRKTETYGRSVALSIV